MEHWAERYTGQPVQFEMKTRMKNAKHGTSVSPQEVLERTFWMLAWLQCTIRYWTWVLKVRALPKWESKKSHLIHSMNGRCTKPLKEKIKRIQMETSRDKNVHNLLSGWRKQNRYVKHRKKASRWQRATAALQSTSSHMSRSSTQPVPWTIGKTSWKTWLMQRRNKMTDKMEPRGTSTNAHLESVMTENTSNKQRKVTQQHMLFDVMENAVIPSKHGHRPSVNQRPK